MSFIFSAIGITDAYLSIGWMTVQQIVVFALIIIYRLQSMQLFALLLDYYENVEDSVDRQRKDVERLSQEIRSLISYISHDLKTVSYS